MQGHFYLEDLSIGQRFTTATRTLEADQIKHFAADYDPQPFHLDEEKAAASFFEGLAASGWQVVGVTMSLLVTGGLPIAGGIIGAGAELSWPKATRPGDMLQADVEIIGIQPSRSRPDRGIVTVKVVTRNQANEAVLALTVKILAFRRSGGAGRR